MSMCCQATDDVHTIVRRQGALMRSVLIVGAGQSGLMLALWLRAQDYDVTVVTDRSAADVRRGRIMSTQVLFGPALECESWIGLDFWRATVPSITTVEFALADPSGQRLGSWSGRLTQAAQSVDQRSKFARWMQVFQDRGGRLVVTTVSVESVDELCQNGRYDLVVVAAASSALADLFPLTHGGTGPRRSLSAIYLHGVENAEGRGQYIGVPGCGEIVTTPALTMDTACHTMLVEAVPGGPWDTFDQVADDPAGHLERMLAVLARFAPRVHERYRHGVLTDPGARLVGAVVPTVRGPVAVLPSGRTVVGIGDTVCRMDPLGAQGANTATRVAACFAQAIVAHEDRPFDRAWMCRVAESCWNRYVRPAAEWTEMLLEPPLWLQKIIGAAGQNQALADHMAAAFAEPSEAAGLAQLPR